MKTEVQLARSLELVELHQMLFVHHGPDEGRPQFVNQHVDKRTGNNTTKQDDKRAEQGAIKHARSNLHHFTRDEGNHNLQQLQTQQDKHAHRPLALNAFYHTVEPIGFEQHGKAGPQCSNNAEQQSDEYHQANKLEQVALLYFVSEYRNGFLRNAAHYSSLSSPLRARRYSSLKFENMPLVLES